MTVVSGESREEEKSSDEGQKGRRGQCVSVQEEEKAHVGVGMLGPLHPHRRSCNLGHMSHKACWVIRLS